MRKLTLNECEKKYIAGQIERFDQKYTMFKRLLWDTSLNELYKKVIYWRPPSEVKAGFTLKDQALRGASRLGTVMEYFDASRPNPSSISREVASIITPRVIARNTNVSLPLEGEKLDISDPEKVTRDIKKVAVYFGTDLVGICKLDMRWVYSHSYGLNDYEYYPQEIPDEFQYAVVKGYNMDYGMYRYFPAYIPDVETSLGYSRMAIANAHLTQFIRFLGYKAIPCTTNDVAITIPMAMQAGLGELGRNGLLITPKHGSRLRLSKVLTNLPLVANMPIEFGVTEFCTVCKKCADNCPSQAITHGERTYEPPNISSAGGTLKWQRDAERCLGHWAAVGKGCSICISVCPFNKPDNWFHRSVRWFVDNVRRADSFYLKMDTLLGYGRPAKADSFWENWQPQPSEGRRVKIK